jgi:hypothetical protein
MYESTDAGVLHAINPANGHDLWHFSGGGPIGGDLSTTAAILPDGSIVCRPGLGTEPPPGAGSSAGPAYMAALGGRIMGHMGGPPSGRWNGEPGRRA